MTETSHAINAALGSVLIGAGQITQIAQVAYNLFAIYKNAREKWKADHPDQADQAPFLTDAEMIAALAESANSVVQEADRLLAKYAAPAQPDPDAGL